VVVVGTIEVVELSRERGTNARCVYQWECPRRFEFIGCVYCVYYDRISKDRLFFLGSFVEGVRIQLQVDVRWRLLVFLAKRDL